MGSSNSLDCSIVIPIRRLDDYTKIAIAEINRYYNLPIIIVADEVPDKEYQNVQFLLSRSGNLSDKRNQGVEYCQSQYVAFLDSDAYPEQNWLESAILFLQENPKAGVVGGPNGKYEKLQTSQENQYLASLSFLLNSEPTPSAGNTAVKQKTISSSNMVFRKKDYFEVGGMNTNIFTGEDIELCYKFVKSGRENYFLPLARVRHKQRSFKGFLLQRFVWGRGIFTVIRYTGRFYLKSLLPFVFTLGLFLLAILNLNYLLGVLIGYVVLCFLESLRIAGFKGKTIAIFPYILLSQLALGLGAIYSLIAGDINNDYSSYNNAD